MAEDDTGDQPVKRLLDWQVEVVPTGPEAEASIGQIEKVCSTWLIYGWLMGKEEKERIRAYTLTCRLKVCTCGTVVQRRKKSLTFDGGGEKAWRLSTWVHSKINCVPGHLGRDVPVQMETGSQSLGERRYQGWERPEPHRQGLPGWENTNGQLIFEKCSISLAIRETKATLWIPFTPVGMAVMKETHGNKYQRGYGGRGTLMYRRWECKLAWPQQTAVWSSPRPTESRTVGSLECGRVWVGVYWCEWALPKTLKHRTHVEMAKPFLLASVWMLVKCADNVHFVSPGYLQPGDCSL